MPANFEIEKCCGIKNTLSVYLPPFPPQTYKT